jgi:hypothetical protein
MQLPLIIASGQGVIPFLFLGVPAAAIGVICLGVAVVLTLKKNDAAKKTVRKLSVIGALLIAFLFVSPTLDPVVFWVLDRVMPQR